MVSGGNLYRELRWLEDDLRRTLRRTVKIRAELTAAGAFQLEPQPPAEVCPDCEVGGGLHAVDCPRVRVE